MVISNKLLLYIVYIYICYSNTIIHVIDPNQNVAKYIIIQ